MTFVSYVFAFLKYTIYGLSVFFTGALTQSTDVLDILALRFLFSFVVLFALKQTGIIKVNVRIKEMFLVTERKSVMKNLLLASLFEPVLYMFFETAGISGTSRVTAAVILSLIPVASCIAETLILKEKTTLMQKIFLAVGIAGVIYIAVNTDTSSGKDSVKGILFMVLAVVVGALFMVFSRKSSGHFKAFEITYTSCFAGMFVFNAVNVVRHLIKGDISHYFDPFMSAENLAGFLFLSVVSTIVATGMNNYALGKIQASTMSAFSGISTLVTILTGVLFNNEKIFLFHCFGFALILIRMIGVSYISIKKEKKKNA